VGLADLIERSGHAVTVDLYVAGVARRSAQVGGELGGVVYAETRWQESDTVAAKCFD
jgi:hypothetical protein